jgi:hypothetical protein
MRLVNVVIGAEPRNALSGTDGTIETAKTLSLRQQKALRFAVVAALIIGVVVRLSVLVWTDPWGPHHPDEHILPLEALAVWEGIAPQEEGWPGSTTILALSTASAVQYWAHEGKRLLRVRKEPEPALEDVTEWIGGRFVDPTANYRLGRSVSVITGILQLFAVAWALSQWVGPLGVAIGTLATAIAPLSVEYSQFVLADITGLLFATILVGLIRKPTPRRLIASGALAGLAASSKFHFGLWMLAPPLAIWLDRDRDTRSKWWLTFCSLGIGAWVILTLVPWFWINPLLELKEFAGVVLVKVMPGSPLKRMPSNIAVSFAGLGVLIWFGALCGLFKLRRNDVRRLAPVLVTVGLGALALTLSAVVFDRYGLSLLPGLTILAAMGWERWLLESNSRLRIVGTVALAACLVMTTMSLVTIERLNAEVDVDVLTKRWILANVPRGQRVAIQNEVNAFLPRTPQQLLECANSVQTPRAYAAKWLVEGSDAPVHPGVEAMQSVVLNDELFHAYWCRRELQVQRDPGFNIVPFHAEPRFGSVLEGDVVKEFRDGGHELTGGVDVLVVNRPIETGVPPAQIFRTSRGQRLIYIH